MITIHCITLLNHSYQEQYFSLFVNVNYHVYHYYMYFNLGNCMLVSVQLVDVVVVVVVLQLQRASISTKCTLCVKE